MKVNEIFMSIDGEVNQYGQGRQTLFIRLAGCNLRCHYCDTKHRKYKEYTTKEIDKKIEVYNPYKITITGGEPLLQVNEVEELLTYNPNLKVSIETNGTIQIPYSLLRKNISFIVDYKLNYPDRIRYDNFKKLNEDDFIKFIIKDYNSFRRSLEVKRLLKEITDCTIAFSPMYGEVHPRILLEWIQKSGEFDIMLNTQLHKIFELK